MRLETNAVKYNMWLKTDKTELERKSQTETEPKWTIRCNRKCLQVRQNVSVVRTLNHVHITPLVYDLFIKQKVV